MDSILQALSPHLSTEFFGNLVSDYLYAFAVFVGLVLIFGGVRFLLLYRLAALAQRTKTDIDDTLIDIVKSLRPPFYYFLAFYLSLFLLSIGEVVRTIINGVLIVWIVFQAVIAVQVLISHVIARHAKLEDDAEVRAAMGFVGKLSTWVLWVIGGLLILANLGVEITSLVAGLGIGGIAIAFALQNILGDLFSSFAIYFDKPFKVGDFIIVGENLGTVERVGIKTTRLRALQGEELVISNQELTSSRIHNYKQMNERRIQFEFRVPYETDEQKLRLIPELVQETFDDIEYARLDRAHFKTFGEFSLEFEVVYFVFSSDYMQYMDIQQKINLQLMNVFEREGITFAYPTQKLYLNSVTAPRGRQSKVV